MKERRNEKLKERVNRYIDVLGINKTRFCEKCGIGRSTFYSWMKGDIDISDHLMDRIENYILFSAGRF